MQQAICRYSSKRNGKMQMETGVLAGRSCSGLTLQRCGLDHGASSFSSGFRRQCPLMDAYIGSWGMRPEATSCRWQGLGPRLWGIGQVGLQTCGWGSRVEMSPELGAREQFMATGFSGLFLFLCPQPLPGTTFVSHQGDSHGFSVISLLVLVSRQPFVLTAA